MNLERLITTCTELGAAKAIENLGLSAGELSSRKAREIYGTWFTDAVKANRLRPCRVENGHRATRWYKVTDILTLKAADAAQATLANHLIPLYQ